MILSDDQKTRQLAIFRGMLASNAFPDTVISVVERYIGELRKTLADPIAESEVNRELFEAYIENAEAFVDELKAKFKIPKRRRKQ